MKKILVIFLSVLFVVSMSAVLTGCKKDEHTHVFDKQVASENYFAKEATCLEKAKYYYSCSCGEKGTETFEIGAPLGHSFTNYVSDNNATCSKDGTATAQCDRCDATNTATLTGTKLDHEFENGQCIHCGFVKQSEGLSYTLMHDKLGDYYEVTGIGSCKDENVVIPEVYNDLPVKTIGKEAFKGRGFLGITIPASIISIGLNAFYDCNNLTKVNYLGTIDQWAEIDFKNDICLDGGVLSKGDMFSNPLAYARNLYINNELVTEIELTTATKVPAIAFLCCSSLNSVTLSDSVKAVGDFAFYGCEGLTNITIGNGVTSLGDLAFYGCSGLSNITIGNNVTVIGNFAFAFCSGLTSVNGGKNVVSIGGYAFV